MIVGRGSKGQIFWHGIHFLVTTAQNRERIDIARIAILIGGRPACLIGLPYRRVQRLIFPRIFGFQGIKLRPISTVSPVVEKPTSFPSPAWNRNGSILFATEMASRVGGAPSASRVGEPSAERPESPPGENPNQRQPAPRPAAQLYIRENGEKKPRARMSLRDQNPRKQTRAQKCGAE